MKVYIVTWCQDMAQLYGNTMTLKSVRIGFPSADITVIDNASLAEARVGIKSAAARAGCTFVPIDNEQTHHDWIRKIVATEPRGRVVILDPDVVFWEDVEQWEFAPHVLLAGRYLPEFWDLYFRTWTLPRIHTSFWYIPCVEALRDHVQCLCDTYREFDPFAPRMMPPSGAEDRWVRHDTGSLLALAMPERITRFSDAHLDAYDHLFCGTHLPMYRDAFSGQSKEDFLASHAHAKQGRFDRLKGLWKKQDEFFAGMAQSNVLHR